MDVVNSVVMLVALALIVGAVFLLRRGGAVKQAVLMLVLAAVMIADVVIWALPS